MFDSGFWFRTYFDDGYWPDFVPSVTTPIDVPGMKWEMGYDMLEWDAEE